MIERLHTVSRINVPYPERRIFFRLGGNVSRTRLTDEEQLIFKRVAVKAASLCEPQGRWRLVRIEKFSATHIELAGSEVLSGTAFLSLAEGATHIWLGAVTSGSGVVSARDNAPDVFQQAVYDAAASEVTDSAMDIMHQLAASELARRGGVLSARRFSPGYGDMPLDTQKLFFKLLDLSQMGLNLTENYYITPEKSVTAVAAVSIPETEEMIYDQK